jgi:hypothetical protein
MSSSSNSPNKIGLNGSVILIIVGNNYADLTTISLFTAMKMNGAGV